MIGLLEIPELVLERSDDSRQRGTHSCTQEHVTPEGPPAVKRDADVAAYLRAAHAYMLISMPTGTSTILGVFQAILALLVNGTKSPSRLNYCGKKSSPVKSFVISRNAYVAVQKGFTASCDSLSNQSCIKGFRIARYPVRGLGVTPRGKAGQRGTCKVTPVP
jgi:hypothetical protein